MIGSKSLQFWIRAVGLLAAVIVATTGCGTMKALSGQNTKDIVNLEADVAWIKAANKADRTEVAAVQKQVTEVAEAGKQTATALAETAKALGEIKKTVDGHGTAITTLGGRMDKSEAWAKDVVAGLDALRTGKAEKADMDAGFKKLGGQVASVRTQLVDVKHISGAGINEVLVLIEGFPRAQYDEAKDTFTAGCSELTDDQAKELDAAVKFYAEHSIKSIRGLASVEKFVNKKSGKPLEKSDELNKRCAVLRAAVVAGYLAETLKVDVGYAGLGATSDFGPQAKNRSVVVVLSNEKPLDGIAAKPAAPPVAPTKK